LFLRVCLFRQCLFSKKCLALAPGHTLLLIAVALALAGAALTGCFSQRETEERAGRRFGVGFLVHAASKILSETSKQGPVPVKRELHGPRTYHRRRP
jgi:hypothetical protein